MSLKQALPKEIPAATRAVVETMLPGDSVCRLLDDKAEEIIAESALVAMYHQTGRGATRRKGGGGGESEALGAVSSPSGDSSVDPFLAIHSS